MSGKSTIDQIRHYQKDIERCPENAERMIRCIHRLYILPITLEHLQETGVGRSVNSLRKYKGEVGDAAKALVSKWKAMVAAEESDDEAPQIPIIKQQEIKVSSHSSVKHERKSDHHSSKEKSKSKESSGSNNKHHKKSSSSESKSQSRDVSKSHEKPSDSTSSLKRSHSSSSSYSHKTEKDSKSHRNHRPHHDKKQKSESDDSSPPPEKKHKSYSHTKSQSKKIAVSSESEEEEEEEHHQQSDASEDSNSESAGDTSPARNSEMESEVASDSSKSDVESDNSNSSSDHRHRSKIHKSSHHNHKHSSHSKEKEKENKKYKDKEGSHKSKDKEKNKENHTHNKHSDKHSSKKNNVSPDYKELIKENERKIKKEKKDEFIVPKTVPIKQVKLETNDDGSIDSGSGASFADALLGMDSFDKKKNKKPSSSGQKSPSKPSKSSSSSSSSLSKSSERSSSKSKPSSSSSRSIDELVEPPDLLGKKVKLEALDLDISSTLPEINPNYKPLPHVPERCRQPKTISDEDHMFNLMTTKNQRTKVFSGNKVNQSTVPSLFNMCIQLLYENIDAVEYTGGVPFQLLKPLLEKLNADQLYVLEHFNSYLIEDTDDLWKFHAGKEFRNQKRQDLESWRELYVRCMDERERKLKALTANITQSMAKSTPVRQAKLAYVDSVVKPPRNIARKQAKFGTGSGSSATKNPTKHEIVSKAVIGANTPGITVKDTVPPPPAMARAAAHHPTPALLKKKKAPLMQKALQVMKGTRYKR